MVSTPLFLFKLEKPLRVKIPNKWLNLGCAFLIDNKRIVNHIPPAKVISLLFWFREARNKKIEPLGDNCGMTSTFLCKLWSVAIVAENTLLSRFLAIQLSKLIFLLQFLRLPRNCKSCMFFSLNFHCFCLISCVFLVSFFIID